MGFVSVCVSVCVCVCVCHGPDVVTTRRGKKMKRRRRKRRRRNRGKGGGGNARFSVVAADFLGARWTVDGVGGDPRRNGHETTGENPKKKSTFRKMNFVEKMTSCVKAVLFAQLRQFI